MLIRDILRTKGDQVYAIQPPASLREAARKMMEHRCGSLVVCEANELVGIITERDLLRACAAGDPLDETSVDSRMTRDVVSGNPDAEVQHIMSVLTNRRIRHLPIVEDGKLMGLISIGDLVKAQTSALAFENQVLKAYIHC